MNTNTRILAADFEYIEGRDIVQVLEWLAEFGGRAKVMAGGTDLLVHMKLGKLKPEIVIFIGRAGLDYIREDEKGLYVGAATTLREIEIYPAVKQRYSALYEAVRSHSSPTVRNMATVGGNLCNASPAADMAPPLLVHGASVKILSQGGERELPLNEFFAGTGRTVIKPGELLSEIFVPSPGAVSGSSFLKMKRVAMDVAKLNVAVSLERSGSTCTKSRIAFGSVAPTPTRIREAEAVLEGREFSSELAARAADAALAVVGPIIRGRSHRRTTPLYRERVSRVILEEALKAAWQRAGGDLQHG